MFKNTASQKIAVFAFDTTTGAPKTGDAANITVYVNKDWAGVIALTDTSATELDSTNAKGWYLFDVSQTETNADALHFTGKSATANISVIGQLIFTTPANFSTQSIDSNGRVDVIKVAGTTQTARDIGASVLVGDKTGFSLSTGGVQAIWDALTTALTTVGSIGKLLVDNVNATISSRLASASYTAPDNTSITAIKAKTDNLPASPAAVGDIPTANQNADALLDRAAGVETNRTPRQAFRLMLAALTGKLSGAATVTVAIRDTNDTKDRILATVDADGNRSAVTLDAS